MSEIRKHFISRFTDGHVMEADFGQLEVIALAHLCQDPQLIEDIRAGVDMHRVMAAKLYRKDESEVTDKERKTAKQLTFQLQYGAGARSMAKSSNVQIEIAKRFIHNYYARYPKIKEWQEDNIKKVEDGRFNSGFVTPMGVPRGDSILATETGRMYLFHERDIKIPPWKKTSSPPTGFYSTEIKNYPVQGFATGDIVPMIIGEVYRELQRHLVIRDHIKMINTVHDSIVFDVDAQYESDCYRIVHPIMCNVSGYLKSYFNIDFDLPITVDFQIGENWMEMKDYEAV